MLKARLQNLSPTHFKAAMASEAQAILIDVRTPEEFQQFHFDGALNISYLAPDMWERMEQLDKDKTYLIYCRSGRRSVRVGTLMRNGGFDAQKIFHLDGGLLNWEATEDL
ncbi:MAG: rhodanese-like domain-containing protein [Bacteroidota bacterium]